MKLKSYIWWFSSKVIPKVGFLLLVLMTQKEMTPLLWVLLIGFSGQLVLEVLELLLVFNINYEDLLKQPKEKKVRRIVIYRIITILGLVWYVLAVITIFTVPVD